MTNKIFAPLLLSLALAACEPGSTETNSNVNSNPKGGTNAPVSPTSAPSPSAEPSPSVVFQLKTGDKVRVSNNGSFTDATVVSVDEKAGKVTVRLHGPDPGKDGRN